MPKIKVKYDPPTHKGAKNSNRLAKISEIEKFNVDCLGLGNLEEPGKAFDALVAFFDLEGFTNFCDQPEPHLAVTEFIEHFLKWIFDTLRSQFMTTKGKKANEMGFTGVFGAFPIYAKFTGDGMMLVWKTSEIKKETGIGNIIFVLKNVLIRYKSEFISGKGKEFRDTPGKLRCGVSRGMVVELGKGRDYVGSCINIAARIQKLPGLDFAFSRTGLDPQKMFAGASKDIKSMCCKVVNIRGIGDYHVIVPTSSFDSLPPDQRELYRDP